MKRIVSILTALLFAYVPSVIAGDEQVAAGQQPTDPSLSESAGQAVVAATTDADIAAVLSEAEALVASDESGAAAAAAQPDAPAAAEMPAVTQEVAATDGDEAAVPVVADTAKPKKHEQHGSKSAFESFKVPEEPVRTCDEACAKSMKDKNVISDFSNTSDFAENGVAGVTKCLAEIEKTQAYGTHSSNRYINVSNSNLSNELVKEVVNAIVNNKKVHDAAHGKAATKDSQYTVLLNIAGNPSVGDGAVQAIGGLLSAICCLNLAGTNISDSGIEQLIALINGAGIQHLNSINISNTRVTPAGAAKLKEAIAAWLSSHPEAKCELGGDGGVIYKERPAVPVKKGDGLRHRGHKGHATPEIPAEAAAPTDAAEAAEPVVADEAAASTEPVVPGDSDVAVTHEQQPQEGAAAEAASPEVAEILESGEVAAAPEVIETSPVPAA
ncbi:MAG: hypothetical protein LBF56_03425 [Holosporales bacterium]|jgi:hypothetical protein|nr:hypothetical protein [Holosporales bacterium]